MTNMKPTELNSSMFTVKSYWSESRRLPEIAESCLHKEHPMSRILSIAPLEGSQSFSVYRRGVLGPLRSGTLYCVLAVYPRIGVERHSIVLNKRVH